MAKREFSIEHKDKLKAAWVKRKTPVNNKTNVSQKMKVERFSTVQLPKFEEKIGREYVLWGGDNLYPNFLIQLFHRSALHRRCIEAKVDAACGKGLILNTEDQTLLEIANDKETWNEVFEKCVGDYVLFGGFALNVLWDENGEYITEINHLKYSKVRSGKLNIDDEVHQYWYSQDWRDLKTNPPKSFTAYNKETAKNAAMEGKTEFLSQIYYVKDYADGYDYYPACSYDGALSDVQLDIEVSSFHLSNISNGITPSFHINFPTGDPGPEAKFKLFEELSNNYSSSQNAGRMLITFSEGKDLEPKVTPLTAGNDKYYLILKDKITETLTVAHGITSPLLIGLRDGSSGLGNNAREIEIAWTRFLFTTIRPIQKTLLKAFNKLLDGLGYPDLVISIVPEVIFNNAELIDSQTETDTNITQEGNTKSSDSTTTKE